jgi:hypothetical protein
LLFCEAAEEAPVHGAFVVDWRCVRVGVGGWYGEVWGGGEGCCWSLSDGECGRWVGSTYRGTRLCLVLCRMFLRL